MDKTIPQIGHLALKFGGVELPLEVLKSAAGFYIGTFDRSSPVPEPFSRESQQYWSTREAAVAALVSGNWTQLEYL